MSRRTRGTIPGVINPILNPSISGSGGGGGGGSGETNTAANLGDGTGVFKQKEDVQFQFKTFKAGPGIEINQDDSQTVLEITSSMTLTSSNGNIFTLGVTDGGILTVTEE